MDKTDKKSQSREKWLDSRCNDRVSIYHFVDGKPTVENPYPSEKLLLLNQVQSQNKMILLTMNVLLAVVLCLPVLLIQLLIMIILSLYAL